MGLLDGARLFATFSFPVLATFSAVKNLDSLCPWPFVLGLIWFRKDFILLLKPLWEAGALVGMDWHHLPLQNTTLQISAGKWLTLNELAQERLAL